MRYVFYGVVVLAFFLFGCADKPSQKKDALSKTNNTVTAPQAKRKSLKSKPRRSSGQEIEKTVVELQRETGKKSKKKSPIKTIQPDLQEPPEIHPGQRKKVFEFVQIGDEKYPVPRPWRGKRITQKSPPFKDLQQIPVEYTWNRTKLFIHSAACDAFMAMAREAAKDDVDLLVHSGFRSIWYQKNIFTKLMAEGRTWEDLVRYVAPPGYSEHMLGMAVDLYPSNWEFASTDTYQWLQEHAGDFGFSETYPEHGTEGFPWEAWHWRYTASEDADPGGQSSGKTVAKYDKTEQQQ